MKTIKEIASRLGVMVVIVGTTYGVSAATREEMQRLDEAYPPGSVVVCHSDLPGDGKLSLPTTMISRGKVESKENGHTLFSVSVTWRTPGAKGSDAGDLILTFRMNQRSDEKGLYTLIDPESMAVTMSAAGPAGEEAVLKGFRSRFGGTKNFAPYSQTEITEFPAYITRNPGEAPSYCRKEVRDHA